MLAALLFSWADNLTLNIITLAGLTIAVGRVVDDAIVVLENSYRYVQSGYEPEESALGDHRGGQRHHLIDANHDRRLSPSGPRRRNNLQVLRPALADVALALVASLIVAVTIIPVLVSIFLRRRTGDRAPQRTDEDPGEASEKARSGGAGRAALAALHPDVALESAAQAGRVAARAPYFRGGLGLVRFLPVTFFPPSEERLLVADVELPAGTALGRTSERLRPFEDFLQQDAGIKSYQVSIGGKTPRTPSPRQARQQSPGLYQRKGERGRQEDVGPGG